MTDPDKLAWRDKAWYETGSVEWVDGEVNAVDFADKSVTTTDDKKFVYTKLVLATGGTPKNLPSRASRFSAISSLFDLFMIQRRSSRPLVTRERKLLLSALLSLAWKSQLLQQQTTR